MGRAIAKWRSRCLIHHLPRETAERLFVSEARAAAQLRHPSIATVYEVSEGRGTPFVAMECVFNGRSLARHCESSADRLPIEDTVRIARACANALHHAHERGVLHRDIKPRNILLDVGLEPKLVDFGFSAVTGLIRGRSEGSNGLNRYLAPEQLQEQQVGLQADLFSLGVVLYELLAGRHPFSGDGGVSELDRVVRMRHTPVRKFRSDAPRVIEMIIDRCLAKARPTDMPRRCTSPQISKLPPISLSSRLQEPRSAKYISGSESCPYFPCSPSVN
jgi:eukaryotic-like serine/threonine-protein kinase